MRILLSLLLLFSFSFAEVLYNLELKFKEQDKKFLIEGDLNIEANESFKVYIPENLQILKKRNNHLKFLLTIPKNHFPEIFISQKQLPSIDKLAKYKVKIYPPKGYIPITGADIVKIESSYYLFEFPYKKPDINIILGKNWKINKLKLRNDLEIYLYSLNTNHKKDILKLASKYITYYENKIGKFPYKRFSIVETYNPYGYSFPTFTTIFYPLLNKEFIYKTSLPHEILHQWFGCSVYIDFSKGNWAEGLTVYLADYNFSKNKDKYRKLILEKYEAYIDKDISLKNFQYKKDKASEALGYGKGMFVFYMLENLIGNKNFNNGIREFYKSYKFKNASWQDLKFSFEKFSKNRLDKFFNQWINNSYVPELDLEISNVVYKDGFFNTTFTIKQEKDFSLSLPVYIKTLDSLKKFQISISKKEQKFTFKTKSIPLEIYLDPKYETFRHLKDEETDPIIHFALNKKHTVVANENTNISDVENKNVIFEDIKHPILKSLINKDFDKNNFVYAFKNPLGNKKVLLVVNGNINYKHYGNYTALIKMGGKLKKIQSIKTFGFSYKVYDLPEVVNIKEGAANYISLLNKLTNEKLIYVGENHTKFSNHLVQLQIIKYLHNKGKKLIIGMEMFQKPFQKYLDAYIEGKITKREFLIKTQYYKRWGYDFKLYEPILDFAKENKIKVIALNIEKEIIDKVSSKGISSLTLEEKSKLPKSMDFSNFEYRKFLEEIFSRHKTNKSFIHFYESQILWDESMAHNLAYYIDKFPDYTFVILAGNGHLRYRYGIPSRVKRLTGYRGIVVLNDDEIRENISDYVVYPQEVKYKPSVKLGVLITEKDGKIKIKKVLKNSIAYKLGIIKGDMLIKMDNFKIENVYDLKTHLTFFKKGSYIEIKRGHKLLKLHY